MAEEIELIFPNGRRLKLYPNPESEEGEDEKIKMKEVEPPLPGQESLDDLEDDDEDSE